jgi:hypothetical protein
MLRRTKFPNLVDLATVRKGRRLKAKKAERDRTKADRDYRVGLVIKVKTAPLTDVELGFLATLRVWPYDKGLPQDTIFALHKLLTKLLHNPQAITMLTAEADELVGGRTPLKKVG